MSIQSLKVYLAGPMTGIPQFNYPLFHEAARVLREKGLTVISPAEVDTAPQQAAALASPDGDLGNWESITKNTWGDVLSKDVKIVADEVEAVVALPNWNKSRGARLEITCAMICNKLVYDYNEGNPKRMDAMQMNLGILGLPLTGKLSVAI